MESAFTFHTSKPLVIKGKIVGTLGIVRDITECVLTEKKLKKVNRKLEMFFETAMEGISIVDPKENITFVNDAFAKMSGYRKEELVGVNLRKFVDEKGFKEIQRQTETRSRRRKKYSQEKVTEFNRNKSKRADRGNHNSQKIDYFSDFILQIDRVLM